VLTAAALALAAAAAPQVLAVNPGSSAVRFHVNHKLHKVDGVSKSVEGKVLLEPDGKFRTMIRIPVATFDSGDSNRDGHMLETLHAGRFPHVVFKGVGQVPTAVPGKPVQAKVRGELEFHGVTRPVELPAEVEFQQGGGARVKGRLTLGLESFQIERPSLLLIKLDDDCRIDFDLVLGREE